MGIRDLLKVYPSELNFPFKLNKQISCSMYLTNKSSNFVAFEVRTTAPYDYRVVPNIGVVSPGSTCEIKVTKEAVAKAPPDMLCIDKFRIQCLIVTANEDITRERFGNEDYDVEELLIFWVCSKCEESVEMSTGELLDVYPSELKFPFKLNKQISCSMYLTNKSSNLVAFKVRTTAPYDYRVVPNIGVVSRGKTYEIKVTKRAVAKAPPDMLCMDKFRIQCLTVTANEDITTEMFEKEENDVEVFKFRASYEEISESEESEEISESEESEELEESEVRTTSLEASGSTTSIQSAGTESTRKLLRELESDKPTLFSHEELRSFTSNFAPENKIGFGAFAVLFKGRFPNGVPIAVKVLAENAVVETTFKAEVSTMAKTSHRNLVKLYGYCFEDDKKALVYEYMENGSLDNVLFNNHLNLEWEKLYGIAIQTAKALSYLHEGCREQIIHFDVKPGNVLLDSHLSPKLADFGIARLMNRDITHVILTGIEGTEGYVAPEVWMPQSEVTYKCDVYSFGMMMFEVLGRRHNKGTKVWFPQQVWEKFENGQLSQLIEDCGIGENDRKNAEILSMVALWCVQFAPTKRHAMSTVVKMLEKDIPVGKPPNPFPV